MPVREWSAKGAQLKKGQAWFLGDLRPLYAKCGTRTVRRPHTDHGAQQWRLPQRGIQKPKSIYLACWIVKESANSNESSSNRSKLVLRYGCQWLTCCGSHDVGEPQRDPNILQAAWAHFAKLGQETRLRKTIEIKGLRTRIFPHSASERNYWILAWNYVIEAKDVENRLQSTSGFRQKPNGQKRSDGWCFLS